MADVTVRIPRNVKTLSTRIEEMVDAGARDSEIVLKFAIQNSIYKRAFRTGAEYASVQTKIEIIGRIRRIVGFTNLWYTKFPEFGTGIRGAASRPSHVPADYHYGDVKGMAARSPFLHGRDEALPEVKLVYDRHVRLLKAGAF